MIRKIMTKARQMTKPQLKRLLAKLNRMSPKIEGMENRKSVTYFRLDKNKNILRSYSHTNLNELRAKYHILNNSGKRRNLLQDQAILLRAFFNSGYNRVTSVTNSKGKPWRSTIYMTEDNKLVMIGHSGTKYNIIKIV